MSTSADQTNLGKIAKILSIDISAKPHVQLVKKKPQIKITQENLTDDENENQVEKKIFKKLADNNVKGHYFESSNLNFLFQKEETKGDDIEIENNNDWQILDQDKQGIQMTLEQTQELFDTKKQNYIIESDCQIEELKYEIDQDDQSFQISAENSFSETNIMKSIKKSRYLPDIYEKIRQTQELISNIYLQETDETQFKDQVIQTYNTQKEQIMNTDFIEDLLDNLEKDNELKRSKLIQEINPQEILYRSEQNM